MGATGAAIYDEEAIKRIAQIVAEKTIKTQQENRKILKSRWLRNTKRLLEKYTTLKVHSEKAVADFRDTDLRSCLIMLDEEDKADLTIESIKKSELRTYIIVTHIGKMLETLREIYKEKNQSRKFRVLVMRFINKKQYSEIAITEEVDERTIYRDTNDAIEDLSILLFGIDGMVD